MLIRLIADKLTASGLDVRLSADDTGHLVITRDDALCELQVDEHGNVQGDFRPHPGTAPDPKRLADLATALLTGQAGDLPRLDGAYDRVGITLKGVVGLELRARGLDVALEVYPDDSYFGAAAEIRAASPVAGRDAQVYITDKGTLTWICDYRDDHAPGAWELEPPWHHTGSAAFAADIAATLAQAITGGQAA